MTSIDKNCQSLIDTVHIVLECEPPNWAWDKEERGKYGQKFTGHYKNLTITWRNGKLCIMGSLPKFISGNNFYNITNNDVLESIHLIEKELLVDLSRAVISKVDLATTLKLQHSVKLYFPFFGEYRNAHRSNIEASTLYYKRGKKSLLAIYDKMRELKKDRENKPLIMTLNGNYLRFEVRLNIGNTKSIFNTGLTPYNLAEFEINRTFARAWFAEYEMINKQTNSEFQMEIGDRCLELTKMLAQLGIEHLGGTVLALEVLHRSNGFIAAGSETKTRMGNTIRDLSDRRSSLKGSPLLAELNNSFDTAFNVFSISMD